METNNLANIAEIISARKYKPEKVVNRTIVIKIRGKIIGTLQSIVVLSGLPKQGKSTYMTALIASEFCRYDIFQIECTCPMERRDILFIDTESSEFDFVRTIERIKTYSNRDSLPERFCALNCREDNPETITKIVDYYLSVTPSCSLIILDGILDLLYNYNDERECRVLINWLKKITKLYNVCIVVIMHLSKSSGNTLGHFGSMADRYAQSVVMIEKTEQNQLVMKPKFLRSDGDFDPVAISYWDGKFHEVDYEKPAIYTKPKKSEL
jgi:hypothetical protein